MKKYLMKLQNNLDKRLKSCIKGKRLKEKMDFDLLQNLNPKALYKYSILKMIKK